MTRDPRTDALKAVAIAGVVLIHAGAPLADVFWLGVPVFVAIWAFHFEQGLARREGTPLGPYLRDRTARLLVPYAFWTLVYLFVFHHGEWRTTRPSTIVNGWLGGYGWAGQYFFIVLLQLTWIVPALRGVASRASPWLVIVAGGLFNALAVYVLFRRPAVAAIGDRPFVYWLPYVALGAGLARGDLRAGDAARPWWLAAAVASLGFVPTEFARLAAGLPMASPYLMPSVALGVIGLMLAAAPGSPGGAPEGRPSAVGSIVGYVGRNTYPVFLAHNLFLEAGRRLGPPPFAAGSAAEGLRRLGLALFALGASLALGELLTRAGLGSVVGSAVRLPNRRGGARLDRPQNVPTRAPGGPPSP